MGSFYTYCFFLLYDKPKDLNMLPDGGAIDEKTEDENNKQIEEVSWTLKEAMRTKTFWLMMFSQIILPMIHTGLTFHFISIMGSSGITASTAAYILSLLAIIAFPTTFIAGYLLDRIKIKYAAAFVCFLILASLIILLNNNSLYTSIAFAVTQGIALGLSSVLGGVIWPNYYGVRHLGSIRGVIMASGVIGAAIGPMPFGIAFDMFDRYNEAFFLFMVMSVLGVFASLLANKPKKDK